MSELPSISRNSGGERDRHFLYVFQDYDAYFYSGIAEHTDWRTGSLIDYGTVWDDVRACSQDVRVYG